MAGVRGFIPEAGMPRDWAILGSTGCRSSLRIVLKDKHDCLHGYYFLCIIKLIHTKNGTYN